VTGIPAAKSAWSGDEGPVSAGRRGSAAKRAFAVRDFRLLCAGEIVSLTGSQFYLLAMPWLVLQTTHSSLAVGLVTAVSAVPRAVFILIAGALTDRLSPRPLMIVSDLSRMLLVTVLALLTITAGVELWALCAFALVFGISDAPYYPARGALVPRLLPPHSLLFGNAAIQATNQVAMFAGPLLAGSLIAALHQARGGGESGYEWAVGIAFAVDAATFLGSAILLSMMRPRRNPGRKPGESGRLRLWSSMREGLQAARDDRFLRSTLLLVGAGSFFLTGPLYVGLPVLADMRYAGGAGDLGLILSLFGAGSLIGVAPAAAGRALPEGLFAWAMGLCVLVLGIGLVLLGILPSATPAAAVAAIMGVAQGFLVVQFVTLLHRRTPPHMQGRVMSLLVFLVMGLSPLSSGVAGALIEFSVSGLLIGAGFALILIVAAAFMIPSIRPLAKTSTSS